MDHPAPRLAGSRVRILEERDVRAGPPFLVGVEEVVDGRVVLVDGLLHEPQAEDARVEVDVPRRIARDARHVMDAVEPHCSGSNSFAVSRSDSCTRTSWDPAAMKSSRGESIASVSRWAHSMPADRSSPHSTSASDCPDTTVKTTTPSSCTPRSLLTVTPLVGFVSLEPRTAAGLVLGLGQLHDFMAAALAREPDFALVSRAASPAALHESDRQAERHDPDYPGRLRPGQGRRVRRVHPVRAAPGEVVGVVMNGVRPQGPGDPAARAVEERRAGHDEKRTDREAPGPDGPGPRSRGDGALEGRARGGAPAGEAFNRPRSGPCA